MSFANSRCHRWGACTWKCAKIWYALFAGKQALRKEDRAPQEIIPVKVLKAFSKVVELIAKATDPVSLLQNELANAVFDDESKRTSSKKSRTYPRKKKPRRCGAPNIELATAEQRQRLKQLKA